MKAMLDHLGTVNPDGSITLHDENIKFREAMKGHYQRIRPTPKQKMFLAKNGFQWVNSSFISGIGVFDNDLRIRFHNGSLYEYYGYGYIYDGMMRSLSKGQFFNKNIRPTKRYAKIGKLDFPQGTPSNPLENMTDEEIFKKIEVEYIENIVKMLAGSKLKYETVVKEGIKYHHYLIDGVNIYRPISQ